MADLIFYGASDDLVELDGVVCDEYSTEDALMLVCAPDGRRAKVRVRYEDDGHWSVAFQPADEDTRTFEGRVDVSPAHTSSPDEYRAYSARLTLDVPEGTTVTLLNADERD